VRKYPLKIEKQKKLYIFYLEIKMPSEKRTLANEPASRFTRGRQARITWENTPWSLDDRDLRNLLDYLGNSTDPWERSLIPLVEADAVERLRLGKKMN
jgi:hypothetical protein